jgi:hypothetical protein
MWKFKEICLAACLLGVLGAHAPTHSQAMMQVPCAKRDELLKLLGTKYAEKLANTGVTAAGQLVEVFVSDKGTWTVVSSQPSGLSCILAAGSAWEGQIQGKNLTAL